ncbi:hypothetical protein ACGFY7_20995 [Streptomyces prunicolor]|uniref:hypothetical protein n=1 Tax=Streptomyces prunicolor TaxID=67348 RepID=UPI003714CA9E
MPTAPTVETVNACGSRTPSSGVPGGHSVNHSERGARRHQGVQDRQFTRETLVARRPARHRKTGRYAFAD